MSEFFKLPKLTYNYDALEPFLDTKTMNLHYSKHHATYVNNLNEAIAKFPELNYKLEDMLKNLDLVPCEIRNTVRNNGGGHLNHCFFWSILKLNTQPQPQTLKLIKEQFGSLDNFKNQFIDQTKNVFGSGWVWLVISSKLELKLINTDKQDTPLNIGKPLLGIDLWEHAYYLQYQNRRNDYIEAFFSVINWEQVEKNLKEVLIN
ncbi:MAG: superoxide dismutase [Vigna little leaf phytoplasma]|nr:superoxide dismutase [Vigna little leaf phytoplasma]